MLTKLDESVGHVVEALRKRGMLKDSIIVFSTDNGGPPAGFNLNAASNWPLRGTKNTLWEGTTEIKIIRSAGGRARQLRKKRSEMKMNLSLSRRR